MMCLACDANYADTVSTTADGTVQIKIKQKSCDNLMKNCYSYMEAREEASGQVSDTMKSKKFRKKKGKVEDATKKLEECLDDTACT